MVLRLRSIGVGVISMELQEALLQISVIRHQLARTERFRGYRAAPVAFSGLLAVAAGLFQSTMIADPLAQLDRYLTIWISVAAISFIVSWGDVAVSTSSSGLFHHIVTIITCCENTTFLRCL